VIHGVSPEQRTFFFAGCLTSLTDDICSMSDIGLFFASSTGNCQTISLLIAKAFAPYTVDIFDVMHTKGQFIVNYNYLIFGVPTWDRYQLHEDWQIFLTAIKPENLKSKKIALYGSGDQHTFPDNFVDGMGLLYNWFVRKNADIVGSWPAGGYNFRRSLALRNDKFIGLALDEDFQMEMTSGRVNEWVQHLKNEFFYDR
jgi:flavodoxin I